MFIAIAARKAVKTIQNKITCTVCEILMLTNENHKIVRLRISSTREIEEKKYGVQW